MNPFFAYLIKSSISLAVLYCLFRFVMRNDRNHTLNRFLLLGILFVSAIIPFLNIQFFYEEVALKQVEVFREFVSAPVFSEVSPQEIIQPINEVNSFSINPWLAFYILIIVALLSRISFGLFRVTQIIKRAEKRRLQKIVLAVVKDLIQPFTFLNKVVISEKDFTENKAIIVAHEHAHIKLLHAIDLMVCEVFTVVHFFNPFMWLLRRDLKLIHEYQADQAVLNKGIDAQKYQLLVLQKSVGERRFAMANHFTQKPILKRLQMMQKKNRKQWGALKLILFLPLLVLLLQAFARPELITNTEDFIPVKYSENETEKWLSLWTADNIGKGFYEPEPNDIDAPRKENNVLVILMNRNDDFLIEDQRKSKEEIKQIVKNYLHGINPDGKMGPDYEEKEIPFVGNIKVSKGIIVYQHDLESSKEMVQYTLREIGEACLEVRKEKAQILFGKDYFELEEDKRVAIDNAVPVWFTYEKPKIVKPKSPPPKPVTLKKDVELSIPEGISPNNDGIHDFFMIKGIYPKYPNAKLLVFSENGEKLYEQEHYGNTNVWEKDNVWWSGISDKKSTVESDGKLPAGNYNYVLELGNGQVKKGSVMLAKSPPPQVLEVLPANPQYPIPSIRFHEKWININGERCDISDLKNVLEELLPSDGSQQQVELTVYSTVSKERVEQIYAELQNIDDLEIVRKDVTPPTPPPLKPITLKKNGTISFGGKDYSFEEFEQRIVAIEIQHKMISNKNDIEEYRLRSAVTIESGTDESSIIRFKEIMRKGNFVDISYTTI